jgi:uncharacterized membrane protein YeaQ/YmgE (transglycosylase-associated protein family)
MLQEINPMGVMEWFGWLIIGTVSGWLANIMTRRNWRSMWADMIIGIVGALIGGVLFYQGLPGSVANIWSLFAAFTGSVVLLGAYRLLSFAIGTRNTENKSDNSVIL